MNLFYLNMVKNWHKKIRLKGSLKKRSNQRQYSGINPKKAPNGIKSIIRIASEKLRKMLSQSAKYVDQLSLIRLSSYGALKNVEQKKEETQGSMTRKDCVNGADQSSPVTSIKKIECVACHVTLNTETALENQKVYNLTIEDCHEYFANGFLVKNCSDSALYAWRKSLHFVGLKKEKKPPHGSYEQQKEFEKEEMEEMQRLKREQELLW